MREKTQLSRGEARVASLEFIDKTREVVKFLEHAYESNFLAVASITTAQAEGDRDTLIYALERLRDYVDEQIAKLKDKM